MVGWGGRGAVPLVRETTVDCGGGVVEAPTTGVQVVVVVVTIIIIIVVATYVQTVVR